MVFLENVTGLLSNENRTFKLVLSQLAQRFSTVEWITFNLLFRSVKKRPRVVIIAYNLNKEVLTNLRDKFYLPCTKSMFQERLDSEKS